MARWIFCLGCVWITSLVIVAWGAWHLALERGSTGPAVAPPSDYAAPPSPVPSADGGSGMLETENQDLRGQVEALEAKNLELGRKYFHLSLQQWADQNKANDTAPEDIAILWKRRVDLMLNRGRLLDFEDRLSLMFAFATYGEAGVAHLVGVLHNRNGDPREREMALQILRYMNSRRAFDAVLDFRDPELTELDYPYDLILSGLRTMDRGEIEGRFPDILRRINQDLGADQLAPERVEVLLSLAALHNDAQAQRLLRDPRILQENLQGALPLAAAMDTPAAHDFLAFVAENHPDPRTRQLASNLLDG